MSVVEGDDGISMVQSARAYEQIIKRDVHAWCRRLRMNSTRQFTRL
jgi:hypothetical protein